MKDEKSIVYSVVVTISFQDFIYVKKLFIVDIYQIGLAECVRCYWEMAFQSIGGRLLFHFPNSE